MMQNVDKILRAKWVLPIFPDNICLENYSIVIQDGKILNVCSHSEEQDQYVSNDVQILANHALLPSFVNSHTHLAMSYYRGMGDDLPLMEWLTDYVWPAEKATVCEDLVYDGTCHALVESIRSGVGCVNDHYFYIPKVVDALNESGLRGIVSNCILNFGTPWAPTLEHCYKDTQNIMQYTKNNKLVHGAIGPHSPYGTDDESMQWCLDNSKKYDTKIHIHLHESSHEVAEYKKNNNGLSPVEKFYKMGWLNESMIAVHMTQLNDSEMEMVAKSGASVVHCPESNMKLASGISPVQKLIDLGVNVALGTDGAASNNDLDMIGEMRSAAFLGKISGGNPSDLSATTVLKMATYNGAKALGLEKEIGSLEIAKSADIIAIDLFKPETLPVYNPISQIVYAASRDQVTHMWIIGKKIMQNRKLLTLDEKTIIDKSQVWHQKISKAIKSK
jgi:5-methylthioadenosine/S-adenosylhomocysteine deaminase